VSYEIPGPKSLKVLERSFKTSQGGLQRHKALTRAQRAGISPPSEFIAGRAEGSWIIDLDGNRYVDFHAGWASNPFGNANPEIIEAVHEALKRWGFCYHHPLTYELAERLSEISPKGKLTRTVFEMSGTEAVEAAVAKAIVSTGRPLIIAFEDAFHGNSIATTILAGDGGGRKVGLEAWRGGVLHAPYPHSFATPAGLCPEAYADYILWYIECFLCQKVADPESIAGILVEPCMAEGGNWIPPDNFLPGLQILARKYGWLLITDEVLVGLGRTGRMWAGEHWSLEPDLLVMGKQITGGVEPIAAVQATEKVLAEMDTPSGGTFAGSPAACAAALKTLEILKRDGLVERSAQLGAKVAKRLKGWVKEFEIVGDARGLGLLLGVSILNKENHQPDERVALAVYREAMKNGAWIIGEGEPYLRFYPALNIDEDILEKGLTATEEALRTVEKEFVKSEHSVSYGVDEIIGG